MRIGIFDNIGLKKKLLLSYIIFVLMPLLLFTAFCAITVRTTIKAHTLQAATQSFTVAKLSLVDTLQQLDHVLTLVGHQDRVYTILADGATKPIYEQYARIRELSLFLENVRSVGGVDALSLYGNRVAANNDSGVHMQLMDSIQNEPWFLRCKESSGGTIWISNNDYSADAREKAPFAAAPGTLHTGRISAARFLYTPDNPRNPLALVRADIVLTNLGSLLQHSPLTEHGSIILYDERFRSIVDASFSQGNFPAALFEKIDDNTWTSLRWKGQNIFATRATLAINGWHLVSIVPYQDIFGAAKILIVRLIFVMVALGFFAFLVVRGIWKSALERMNFLTTAMIKARSGDLNIRLDDISQDEIGLLIRDFDSMMKQISFLVHERIENSKKITTLELKALQAHINPHFLYNALDMIHCVAIDRGVDEVSRMAMLLARFYRLTLNRGKELISVADQLEHVRLYVDIQNIRFGDKISLSVEKKCPLSDLYMMNLILQPIVENAIIHGILETPNKSGSIRVAVDRTENTLCIVIADNGAGMSDRQLEDLQNHTGGKGYGMHNIEERIRLAYGDDYGLNIARVPEGGTIVRITLPIIIEGETQ